MLLYQVLACTVRGKSHAKTINLKHKLPGGMKILNYLTDCILYQTFESTLNIS